MAKPPSWNEIRTNATAFATRWADATDENAEAQTFWNEFLGVFGIDRKRVATFEARAKRTSTGGRGRIDLFWPGTLVAEHKSAGKDLAHAEEQALDYLDSIDQESFPGVIVTSDFSNLRVRDLGGDNEPYTFPLSKLPEEIDRFGFVAGYQKRKFGDAAEVEANIQAAKLMGGLYEELSRTGYEGHDASVLMTRLLFLMFGDDTGMWEKGLFSEYIDTRTNPDGSDLGAQLALLFQVLDRPEVKRQATLDELLLRFPYVNGHLFSDRIEIPAFDRAMRDELVRCTAFDWSKISPAVFGSLFQAVKSKEERRKLGEHYTTEHNILRALAPLFLDDLWEEFEASKHSSQKLERLHDKLAAITVLDPACGCGNFLVIAYRELRRLELSILVRQQELAGSGQLVLDVSDLVRVTLDNFFGIEVEEWPAKIAATAMFLVDQQANHELSRQFGQAPDRLPIMHAANITVADALVAHWNDVLPSERCSYVVGNPPFMGKYTRSEEEGRLLQEVFHNARGSGDLDYVCAWFARASDYITGTPIRAAFVATNSIAMGEQPAVLWNRLGANNMAIDFAHQTFAWTSEAPGAAAVHVVIVGFSDSKTAARTKKRLFMYEDIRREPRELQVSEINAYLVPGTNVLISTRREHLQGFVPKMSFGSMPNDGQNLLLSPDEAEEIRKSDAVAAKYIHRVIGARELIQGGIRYCLWLADASPTDIRTSKVLAERVENVRKERDASNRAATKKLAATPHLFGEIRQPSTTYIAVPRVSSEARRYVPMAVFGPEVIATDSLMTVSDTSLYTFGILQSLPFMLWNAAVSGRLKSDYRISAEITYNNFPWPEPGNKAAEIESAAQGVLDARALFPDASLADLYDRRSMPKQLVDAHAALDRAVLSAYGLKSTTADGEILGFLFSKYADLTADLFTEDKPKKGRKKKD